MTVEARLRTAQQTNVDNDEKASPSIKPASMLETETRSSRKGPWKSATILKALLALMLVALLFHVLVVYGRRRCSPLYVLIRLAFLRVCIDGVVLEERLNLDRAVLSLTQLPNTSDPAYDTSNKASFKIEVPDKNCGAGTEQYAGSGWRREAK